MRSFHSPIRRYTDWIVFAGLGLDPNTTSLLATGVYGIVNTVFTLPAVFLLDRVGRRPLLMAGAVGCFLSLIVVGSCIAGTGGDFQSNPMAGNVAIGMSVSHREAGRMLC